MKLVNLLRETLNVNCDEIQGMSTPRHRQSVQGASPFDGAIGARGRRCAQLARRRPFPRRGLELNAHTFGKSGKPADGRAVAGRRR